MKVKQFRYARNNLAYLIYDNDEAAAIDGGAVKEIIDFCNKEKVKLKYILNTHDHWDHTIGNTGLLSAFNAEYISPESLANRRSLRIGKEVISAEKVPGHSEDSILICFENKIISGDTLFNGTIGNCYTGDYETYFKSIKKYLSFPKETLIYAGHDLVHYAMGIAKKLDPENTAIDTFRKKYNRNHIYSTLGEELKHNPFIRFNDPELDELRKKTGGSNASEFLRWRTMMTIH